MLSEIRSRRKQLGISQTDLSQQTGVSQSLIAKIETQKTIPSYENAKKLFDYLDSLEEKNQLLAGELMNQKVILINSDETVKKAVRLMELHSVSQLPVVKNGIVVGTVRESSVMAQLGKSREPQDLGEMKVESVMTDSLPQISPNAPFRIVSALLEHHDAILVLEKGKILGILSKSDLLKVILNRKRKMINL